MNHYLPIEKSRFDNIPRDLRTCRLCDDDVLGDEFHYLFTCNYFYADRVKYMNEYFYTCPSAVKFSSLMNDENKNTLLKLNLLNK